MTPLRARFRIIAYFIAATAGACALSGGLSAGDKPVHAPPITAATFVPDHDQLVVGSQAGVSILRDGGGKTGSPLPTRLQHIHDIVFSPDGRSVLLAGGSPAQVGELERFEWPTGRLIARRDPHEDLVYAAAWRPDGEQFATASADGTARIFDAATSAPILTLTGHSKALTDIAFLDGAALVTASRDGTIRLWNGQTGSLIRTLNNHTDAVVGLAARPAEDSTSLPMLASISEDRTARFWQPTIGRLVRFARLEHTPLDLAWIADGRVLFVSCTAGHVYRIDPDTAEVVASSQPLAAWAYTLAVSRDGRRLAVCGPRGEAKLISLSD